MYGMCSKMKLFLLLYTICLISLCNGKPPIQTTVNKSRTYAQLITAELMANYDRINRPVLNMSDAVYIKVQPSLISIINVVSSGIFCLRERFLGNNLFPYKAAILGKYDYSVLFE